MCVCVCGGGCGVCVCVGGCVPREMTCKSRPSGLAALGVGPCQLVWPEGLWAGQRPLCGLGTKSAPGPVGQLRSLQQNHAVRPRPGPSLDVLGDGSPVLQGTLHQAWL